MDTQATVPPPHSGSVSHDDYSLAETQAETPPPATLNGPASSASTVAVTANGSAAAPEKPAAAPEKTKTPEELKAEKALLRKRRQRRKELKVGAPAWVVSLVVHVGLLSLLAASTLSTDVGKKIVANINSALVSNRGGEPEMTPIYADPGAQRSDQAVGNEHADSAGGSSGGSGGFGGIGTGPPSATPAIGKVGRVGGGGGGSGTGIGGFKFNGNLSPLANLTTGAPGMDLGGGGLVAGDVTYEATDVGQSLDQIAREILRHLSQHKLTVIWLFDESESMKDDQKAIREKFDRVATELKTNVDNSKKAAGALNHAIVGFGADIHYELEKPTIDIDVIGKAIDRLRVDDSGTENTLHAINEVIAHYGGLVKRDRKLLIVLVTDESGDDGAYVEEARQAAVGKGVPLYIIGRQSLFGYERAHLRYVDPVTKDVYWPAIRRGPETADVELMQWDGLHDRWDEQPSGFAPYELARMAKETGGIYFLLPSEENMRVRQREKAYRIADLKEYVPDYANRALYLAARQKSEFRRTLYEIIQMTRWQPGPNEPHYYRRHFPIDPAMLVPACQEAMAQATVRLNLLLQIQKRMEGLQKLRDRESEKRWQAHYDLMLAQVVAYQVKSYEYRATLEEMAKKPPRPNKMPTADLVVEWVVDHSHERKAPKENTEKKYVEAAKLLKEVIARHPKTPWADLAQDELDRGLGTQRNEWHHNPKYDERAKLVPKY